MFPTSHLATIVKGAILTSTILGLAAMLQVCLSPIRFLQRLPMLDIQISCLAADHDDDPNRLVPTTDNYAIIVLGFECNHAAGLPSVELCNRVEAAYDYAKRLVVEGAPRLIPIASAVFFLEDCQRGVQDTSEA